MPRTTGIFRPLLLVTTISVFLLVAVQENGYAIKSRKDYFYRPQIGAWFGPVTPVGKGSTLVEANLSGGIFFRYTLLYRPLKIGLDSSYQAYDSKGVNELRLVPIYANLLYQLPVKLPIRFQFKAGVGTAYNYIKPDKWGQWDPVFMGGFELSFPAGRLINIGLRIDYLYIYQGYIDNSSKGGHIINSGIMLYFNL